MKNVHFLPVVLLLLCSCTAPRMVTKISPEAPEGNFAMGREYIALSNDHIDVELGFDGIYGSDLVFDLVVFNGSPKPLNIQAKDFYYVLLDSATADSSLLPPHMALHPEKVLHNYDEMLDDKEGQKKANTLLGFLDAGVGLLASTAGFLSTDNPAYISDAVFNTLGTANYYIAQDKQIQTELEMIDQEKELVDEEIFRSMELAPGEHVSGYVYFPRQSDASYYMFCFPVEDQLFQFVYRQEKVWVYD